MYMHCAKMTERGLTKVWTIDKANYRDSRKIEKGCEQEKTRAVYDYEAK